ncbi:MAG: FtsX-like permease family protein [Bacteroidaceae bacterium]|nr:FtsX-like permease family protein [Bacteroidaceae bacterium]
MKAIFQNLWNRKREEIWLFLELIIITIVSWVVFDPAIVNLYYRSLPMGYDTDRLLYAEVEVSAMGEDTGDPYEATEERRMRLLRQLKAVEGVENAYFYDQTYEALGNDRHGYWMVPSGEDTLYITNIEFIPDANFFETYGLRPLPGSPSVEELSRLSYNSMQAVLTRSAAIAIFGTEDAVGRRFQFITDPPLEKTVAGVVEDVRVSVPTAERASILMPSKLLHNGVHIILRLQDGINLHRFLDEHRRDLIRGGQTDFCRISRVMTYEEHLEKTELAAGRTQEVNRSLALAMFFLLNLILAVIGTVWLQAKRRTEECGVRRAFGATRPRLLASFLAEGAALATVAVLIGCIIFLNYAYSGLSTVDGIELFEAMYLNFASYLPADRTWVDGFWPHFLIVSACVYLIMLVTVLIGTAIPAWRITRTQITEALREE